MERATNPFNLGHFLTLSFISQSVYDKQVGHRPTSVLIWSQSSGLFHMIYSHTADNEINQGMVRTSNDVWHTDEPQSSKEDVELPHIHIYNLRRDLVDGWCPRNAKKIHHKTILERVARASVVSVEERSTYATLWFV